MASRENMTQESTSASTSLVPPPATRKKMSAPGNLQPNAPVVPKGRSLSMRQSSSAGRRAYNDYGYLPKNTTPTTRSGATSAMASPEIVVNGHGNEGSGDSVGSGSRHRSTASENSRLGTAANPNRSDMPDVGRRKTHDPATSLVSLRSTVHVM